MPKTTRGITYPDGSSSYPEAQWWADLASTTDTAVGNVAVASAPKSHTHVIGDVTSLQAALDGKSATGHKHVMADITDAPAAQAPAADQDLADPAYDTTVTCDGVYYRGTLRVQRLGTSHVLVTGDPYAVVDATAGVNRDVGTAMPAWARPASTRYAPAIGDNGARVLGYVGSGAYGLVASDLVPANRMVHVHHLYPLD